MKKTCISFQNKGLMKTNFSMETGKPFFLSGRKVCTFLKTEHSKTPHQGRRVHHSLSISKKTELKPSMKAGLFGLLPLCRMCILCTLKVGVGCRMVGGLKKEGIPKIKHTGRSGQYLSIQSIPPLTNLGARTSRCWSKPSSIHNHEGHSFKTLKKGRPCGWSMCSGLFHQSTKRDCWHPPVKGSNILTCLKSLFIPRELSKGWLWATETLTFNQSCKFRRKLFCVEDRSRSRSKGSQTRVRKSHRRKKWKDPKKEKKESFDSVSRKKNRRIFEREVLPIGVEPIPQRLGSRV